ncbi:MAG TPA: transporter [Opitutaceae bacterium]|nr:transporter [Opitutaceae bacterium]
MTERYHQPRLFKLLPALFLLGFFAATAQAQQPFTTDDANVTPKGKFHLQIGNEYDILQRSAFPALRQNTASLEINYGLLKNVEIGLTLPLLGISSSKIVTPRSALGIGDSTLNVKYNFYKEKKGTRPPSMAISAEIRFPTGNTEKDLGAGLTDYFINGVLQKSLSSKTTFRLNGGIFFAGNQQSGELGIKVRGRVFTAGSSLVKQFTKKLDLGAEITGAVTGNFILSEGQLQGLFGGNYALTNKMTFDFGIVGGRFAASPRVGLLLGLSIDF